MFNGITAITIDYASQIGHASGKVNLRVIGGVLSMIQSIMAINNTDIAIIISRIIRAARWEEIRRLAWQ